MVKAGTKSRHERPISLATTVTLTRQNLDGVKETFKYDSACCGKPPMEVVNKSISEALNRIEKSTNLDAPFDKVYSLKLTVNIRHHPHQ